MAGESFRPSFFSGLFPEFSSKVTAALALPLVLAFLALVLAAAAAFYVDVRLVLLSAGGVVFLLAMVCALLLASQLNQARRLEMEETLRLFETVNDGKADLSRPSAGPQHKGLEPVFNRYEEFLDTIRQLIGEIRRRGIGIAVNSTKVAATVESTAAKTQGQKELSEVVSTSSNEASQAIAEVSQNTQYVSERTTNNLEMARQSFTELADITEKIGMIHETVTSFSKTVDKLGRNSRDILEIVSIINTISEQTNLLSLNATIEAARASEHGKGFAVVAEEVRDLARRITPATEKISENIKMMTAIVERTQQETEQIMEYSEQTDEVVKRTTDNFSSLISDFEAADDQLMRIAAAIEELSTNNAAASEKAEQINTLTQAVAADMETSASAVHDLTSITEQMLEMVASFRTGTGRFDAIISRAGAIREIYQEAIATLHASGANLFDTRYKEIPETSPQKYETSYSAAFLKQIGPLLDQQLGTIEGAIYCLAIDRNGYIPAHHAAVSQPMTGNPERDLLYSRHQRIYMNNETERKRCSHTQPLLLQTYMRDTGEILNDLSMPIFINNRHWGALIIGLRPEALLEEG